MKQSIFLVIPLVCTACLMQSTATAVPVYEVPFVEPPIEPTAPPACQHYPGVTVEIQRKEYYSIVLHASGLQPGEIPYISYSTSSPSGMGSINESYNFAEGADENGEFLFPIRGLEPLGYDSSATWDIRFIHARGVECAQVTLP